MKRIVILGAGESGAGAAVLAKKEGFIIRKTKCFVTAKRNVLFAKRSVYKKELLLYCDTRGTLFLFVNT